MNDTVTFSRRRVLQSGAVVAGLATAGCLGGGGTKVDERITDEDFPPQFSASEGDVLEVTIEAEGEGASVGVIPSEAEVSLGDQVGWGWEVDPNEDRTEEIEIPESDDYSVWVSEGAAHVTIE